MNLETPKTIVPKSAKDLFALLEKVETFERLMPDNISKFQKLSDTWDLIDVALDTNGQYDGWETVLVK